ncbi:hypothetical protein [Kurthia huakuii]|uniref:hypothetical protein n=1 Tax=Kurthia huakuii TaxID=1421019 RepID=UPI0004971706|nr:hypothetical protein [Kurthia huakuii]MBM7699328.1 hypothetical protein [Kurthia huakuii]
MTTEKLIQSFYENIPTIPKEQNYWLLRANSGRYYQDFLKESYIAIKNYNIPLQEFIESSSLIEATENDYADIISNYLIESNHNINYISKQLYTFINKIKQYDLILTPSKRSEYYLLGYAGKLYEENSAFFEDFTPSGSVEEIEHSPYLLRRKVIWLKEVHKNEIDNSFLKIRNTQQALININQYANIIDRITFPFYIKNEQFHANFYAQGTSDFSIQTWSNYHNILAKRLGDRDAKKFFLKQNIQSPGYIEMISTVKNIVDVSTPYFTGALIMLGVKVLHVRYKETEVKGLLPWLFTRKRINKSIDLDNQLKQLEIDRIKRELDQPSVAEQVPEMRITANEAGRLVLPSTQRQTDSSDSQDGDRPLEQEQSTQEPE